MEKIGEREWMSWLELEQEYRASLAAVGKTMKVRRQRAAGIPPGLSRQQEKIYMLREQGLEVADIAEEIGGGRRTVQVQIRRIETKMRA